MAPLDQNYYSELIVYLLINEPSDDFQKIGCSDASFFINNYCVQPCGKTLINSFSSNPADEFFRLFKNYRTSWLSTSAMSCLALITSFFLMPEGKYVQ